ncbi:MAG: hypothetical protein KBF43_10725 [Dermatophilaceae bacterium]|nr:hypothetical protein [Actinomycetales bacterium]MBP9919049.1 hypothetical protein [Dermatophilaceae bacterium]
MLVDHWDPTDWTRLWWVRAQLRWEGSESSPHEDVLAHLLAARHPQYRDGPSDRVLVFRVEALTGWSGSA